MIKEKDYRCECGRPSEVKVNGKYMCWELYLIDEPMKWKPKYPGQKPRHTEQLSEKIT